MGKGEAFLHFHGEVSASLLDILKGIMPSVCTDSAVVFCKSYSFATCVCKQIGTVPEYFLCT